MDYTFPSCNNGETLLTPHHMQTQMNIPIEMIDAQGTLYYNVQQTQQQMQHQQVQQQQQQYYDNTQQVQQQQQQVLEHEAFDFNTFSSLESFALPEQTVTTASVPVDANNNLQQQQQTTIYS